MRRAPVKVPPLRIECQCRCGKCPGVLYTDALPYPTAVVAELVLRRYGFRTRMLPDTRALARLCEEEPDRRILVSASGCAVSPMADCQTVPPQWEHAAQVLTVAGPPVCFLMEMTHFGRAIAAGEIVCCRPPDQAAPSQAAGWWVWLVAAFAAAWSWIVLEMPEQS